MNELKHAVDAECARRLKLFKDYTKMAPADKGNKHRSWYIATRNRPKSAVVWQDVSEKATKYSYWQWLFDNSSATSDSEHPEFDLLFSEPPAANPDVLPEPVESQDLTHTQLISVAQQILHNLESYLSALDTQICRYLINGFGVTEIAQILKLSKPNISRRVKRIRTVLSREFHAIIR